MGTIVACPRPWVEKMRLVAILVLLLGLLCQDALATGPTVKVNQVDMSGYPEVVVYVSVADERGAPVTGLAQVDFEVTEDGSPVSLVDFAGMGSVRLADIVFVFDTTTSMGEEVTGMKQTSLSFADKLERSNIDYRLGLVDFGDIINRTENPDGRLTEDADQFRAWINQIRLVGGGFDIPEFSLGALQQAVRMGFRDEALKILILITDAPPHHYRDPSDGGVRFDDPSLTLEQTLRDLREANVTTYVVAPRHSDYDQIVRETNGQFFDIHGSSDFTTIIDQIGGLIATQYRLVYVSPRPTYDGTRRNIRVTVGEGTGTGTYLEKHLLNIQSSVPVGLVGLTLLLILLLIPVGMRSVARSKVQPTPTVSTPPVCPHCGHRLRLGAQFCSQCGQTVTAVGATVADVRLCPRCAHAVRHEAKYCNHCGYRL